LRTTIARIFAASPTTLLGVRAVGEDRVDDDVGEAFTGLP
jgi:hypothetical protein